jgi:hypothetical protein
MRRRRNTAETRMRLWEQGLVATYTLPGRWIGGRRAMRPRRILLAFALHASSLGTARGYQR